MNLKNTYVTFLQDAAQREESFLQQTEGLSRQQLKDKDNWFRGLAILDHSISKLPEAKDEVHKFYQKLIAEGLDFKASVYLDEEDYEEYWNILHAVLNRLAEHFPEVYPQIALQYYEARWNYKNNQKLVEYLNKGIEHRVPIAIAVKGYFLYCGIAMEKDQQAGLQLLNSSDDEWNILYKAYIAMNEGRNEEVTTAMLDGLKASNNDLILKNVLSFEGSLLEAAGEYKAAEALFQQVADKYDGAFAKLKLGVVKFAQLEELNGENKEEIFALWQEAFELGTVDAANHLGYNSLPSEQNGNSYDLAIHWFKLGFLYHNAFAAYRLALIYLYIPELNDPVKGIFYLDEAIKIDSGDAMIEKAEILMEGGLLEKDEAQALAFFKKAAEKNMPYAINRLGYFYEAGLVVSETPDIAQALTYYEKAGEMNFPMGLNNAGRVHRYGFLGEADHAKAQQYFEKGVTLNSPYSMTELALMYEDGSIGQNESGKNDLQKSFDLFDQAAALDYPFGLQASGTYLENGYHNDSPNPHAAFLRYKRGAELGDISCIFETGRCYRHGTGVEQNPDLAISFYQRAAEGGNPKAMVELGLCYEYEYGVAFDAQQAFNYMEQAAELGYYYGEYKLGYYYMHGLTERNTEKAVYWLTKAGQDGSGHAELELGDYYLYDIDEIGQAEKAIAFYQQAFEKGILNEGLGLCYEYGIGVEYNMSEAFKYYEIAANNGYIVAMYHTGRCYLEGAGVKENAAEAYRWFNESAQQDNAAAQYNLGMLLLNGKGVAMDKEAALEWLNKSAATEYSPAQFELGNCYLMADGVEENEETAMYWFEKAADQGHEKAMKLTGRKTGK